jgi:Tfp pilus assembly PilM family ATPase
MSYEEQAALEHVPATRTAASDAEVVEVLETGIREVSSEVRNSLDFHRSQEGGGDVSHVVLSGAAQDIPGFAEALELSLGVDVRGQAIELADERLAGTVSTNRLAVAAGLAVTEAPR